ncbi:unnamed protein product, partial [Durusdinium trenchii]
WMGLFGHRSMKRTMLFGNAPWLHMFSLQSKIRQSDRDQQKWSSEGNTKVKQ